MKTVVKGGIYRLVFMAFNFLVGIFIAAIGGTETFGMISLMIVNAAIFLIVTGFGSDSAIIWHGASSRFTRDKLFTITFFTALIQISLFVLISLIVYKSSNKLLLSTQNNFHYYYFELLYFCGLVLLDKYVSIMYAQQKSAQCNRLLAGFTFIGLSFLTLTWFGVFKMGFNPFAFFCVFTFLQSVSLVFFYHSTNRVRFIRISNTDINSFLGFSFVVFISNLIQFVAYRADYWLIDFYRNTEQVGIYAQANRFAQLLWIIPNILAALIAPLIAAKESNFNTNDLSRTTRVVSGLNIISVAGVILSAFFFYSFVLQQPFYNGFQALLIMIPGFCFFSITIILAAWFSAKRLLWVNLAGSSICLIIIIVVDIILIPHYGINGAAWGNAIAYTASTIFSVYMFLRYTKIPLVQLFRFHKQDWKLISKLQS